MTAQIDYANDEYNIVLREGSKTEETGWKDLPEGSVDLHENVGGKHILAVLQGFKGEIPGNSVFELKPLDVTVTGSPHHDDTDEIDDDDEDEDDCDDFDEDEDDEEEEEDEIDEED